MKIASRSTNISPIQPITEPSPENKTSSAMDNKPNQQPLEPSLAAKVTNTAVTNIVQMGMTFGIVYGMTHVFQGIGTAASYGYNFLFPSPQENINYYHGTLNLTPFQYHAKECIILNNQCPLYEPQVFSSALLISKLAAMSVPTSKILNYAKQKLFTYIEPTPTRQMVASKINIVLIPYFAAMACNKLGVDIDPFNVAVNTTKFLIFDSTIRVMAEKLNAWTEELERENAALDAAAVAKQENPAMPQIVK